MPVSLMTDLTSFGAAGIMGAMWLWERKSSTKRERQLDEAHERIQRDEQRLEKLTEVVAQNTAALTRFDQTQRETCLLLQQLVEEMHHEQTRR